MSDAVPSIGPLLQKHRKDRGLTLEQLAALSGVSKSMLSQIEREQANPTFAILWSLTKALKIDMADLVGSENAGEDRIELVGAHETPEIRSRDGLCRIRILGPAPLAGATEWYDFEAAPGGILDSAPHAGGASEHLTCLSGMLEVTAGGATRVIAAGETARYPADVHHRIRNAGEDGARGLLVLLFR